jgi:zinc transporter 2
MSEENKGIDTNKLLSPYDEEFQKQRKLVAE